MKSITISIPAYNDIKTIKELVSESIKTLEDLKIDWNIFIVDDGSTDNSYYVLNDLSKRYNNIVIHTHKINYGFGQTIKEVFQVPQSEWVLFLSGDNQFPASNLKQLIKYTNKYDFILGYRLNREDNFYRILNSKVYNIIISILAKKRIYDVNSIALFKSEIVKDLVINSKSAFVHAEILLKVIKRNVKVTEVPILHNRRVFGDASGGKIKTILFTIFELIKFTFGKL